MRRALFLAAVLAGVTAAPASARLIAYTSTSCDQGGGEPKHQMFGPPACALSIWVANVDGSSPHRVTLGRSDDFGGGGDSNPTWSPDGTRIIYERSVAPVEHWASPLRLWSVRPDGTDARALTSGGEYEHDTGVLFSPDGSLIAFQTDRASGSGHNTYFEDVYTIRPDGTGLHAVSDGGGIAAPLGWSPDGTRILYGEQESAPVPTWDYNYSARPDGSDRQPATDGEAANTHLSFAPNGQFAAWGTPSFTTAVVDFQTGEVTTLAPPGILPGPFVPGEPALMQATAYSGAATINNYVIDLNAPGYPHRLLAQGRAYSNIQPDGSDPVPQRTIPVAFTYQDPYPPFAGGPPPDDPWAGDDATDARSVHAGPSRSDLPYAAIAVAGLRSVWFSVAHRVGHGHCSYFTGRHFLIHGRCGETHWRRIPSAAWWATGTKHLPHGTYEVRFRAVDRHGKRSKSKRRVVHL